MVYLNFPPLVEQVDEMSCWAAALEAWLSVTPGRKQRSQHELIGVMEKKAALNADGYLITKKGIPLLAQMVGMGVAGVSEAQEGPVNWYLSTEKAREKRIPVHGLQRVSGSDTRLSSTAS